MKIWSTRSQSRLTSTSYKVSYQPRSYEDDGAFTSIFRLHFDCQVSALRLNVTSDCGSRSVLEGFGGGFCSIRQCPELQLFICSRGKKHMVHACTCMRHNSGFRSRRTSDNRAPVQSLSLVFAACGNCNADRSRKQHSNKKAVEEHPSAQVTLSWYGTVIPSQI